ncbi:MAG: hypothetical protein ACREVK_02965 [Gammaproteobacteria bacterium]
MRINGTLEYSDPEWTPEFERRFFAIFESPYLTNPTTPQFLEHRENAVTILQAQIARAHKPAVTSTLTSDAASGIAMGPISTVQP